MKTGTLLLLVGCRLPALTGAQQPEVAAQWEVTGTIKGEKGPIKDIWVVTTGPQWIRSVQTHSQGRYTLKGSLPGTYSIRIQKPDDAGEPRSRTLTLASGQKVDRFDFLLPRGAVIAGKVVDRAGQPVSGMIVVAYVKSYEQGPLRLFQTGGALTDDRGGFRIAHLPDGDYFVAALATARKALPVSKRQPDPVGPLAPAFPPVTFSPGGRSPATAAVIEIRGGVERSGVDITMQKEPVYCVFFRAESAYPDPEGNLQIAVNGFELVDPRGLMAVGGSTHSGQDSQVCGLPQGEYRFNFLGFFKQPLKGVGYSPAMAVVDKRHVELGTVNLAGLQDLNGTVAVNGAKPGDPVPEGIRIALVLRNRGLHPNDRLVGDVQKNGSFILPNVYLDSYGLRIENLPAGHYIAKIDQNGRDVRRADVRPDGGSLRIELAPDGPTLSGKVLTEGRDPVPVSEATVFLIPSRSGEVRIAQTDQSGTYSFSSGVEPGEYKLVAAPDLPESHRRDGQIAARFLSGATEVKLAARESKILDQKVRGAQ